MACTTTPVLDCSLSNTCRGAGSGGANTGCVCSMVYHMFHVFVTRRSTFKESLVGPCATCSSKWASRNQAHA